jgi:hypothetical protein
MHAQHACTHARAGVGEQLCAAERGPSLRKSRSYAGSCAVYHPTGQSLLLQDLHQLQRDGLVLGWGARWQLIARTQLQGCATRMQTVAKPRACCAVVQAKRCKCQSRSLWTELVSEVCSGCQVDKWKVHVQRSPAKAQGSPGACAAPARPPETTIACKRSALREALHRHASTAAFQELRGAAEMARLIDILCAHIARAARHALLLERFVMWAGSARQVVEARATAAEMQAQRFEHLRQSGATLPCISCGLA